MSSWRLGFCGVAVVLAASSAEAQYNNINTSTYGQPSAMTGSSGGMFGTTSTGGGRGGTTGGATGGFGASANQSGFGVGGTQSGFGVGGGQAGRGGATGVGNAQGSNGFLGANNNPNAFLGRNNQGQQGGNNQFGQGGGRGGGQRGMDQSLQNLLNGGGQFGQSNANSRTIMVRPQQKIAFEHPTLKTPVVVQGIETRIAKLSTRYPHLKSVQVAAGEDGVVVLRGTVDSMHSAKVTESLVRMEPGVKSVQNELNFPPPSAVE